MSSSIDASRRRPGSPAERTGDALTGRSEASLPPSPYARPKPAAAAAGERAEGRVAGGEPEAASRAGAPAVGPDPMPRAVRREQSTVTSAPLAPARERGQEGVGHARESMLRRRTVRPKQGWRSVAYDLTGGRWNPGPGPEELRRRRREQQIATQLRGKHVTAFFCLKGGISKTSTTAATSIALADLRPDPVFAIDANPDAGDLAERLLGEQRAGITALARHVDDIGSLEHLSRYTATAGRLTVLPGEPNPTLGDSLRSEDFERIMAVVRRYYSFVQIDCGTGVTHPLMSGILRHADTAVIPASWSVTGAKRAAETIDWLAENGFEHLARTSIVVLTAKDLVSRSVDKEAVLRHLDRAADLVVVPADAHVADGALLEWDALGSRTREAYLEIAAAITARFESR